MRMRSWIITQYVGPYYGSIIILVIIINVLHLAEVNGVRWGEVDRTTGSTVPQLVMGDTIAGVVVVA